uniref:Uncharacterized protein n=1 Tax=Arundo donax TaxID=35708 RepID=A0A0A9ASS5_ARUDO
MSFGTATSTMPLCTASTALSTTLPSLLPQKAPHEVINQMPHPRAERLEALKVVPVGPHKSMQKEHE